jgi:hypothetical protein
MWWYTMQPYRCFTLQIPYSDYLTSSIASSEEYEL